MPIQLLVPVHTSPEDDFNTERLAQHVVAVAAYLKADVSTVMHLVDYPSISNPLARSILDVPALIAQARAAGRERGEHVLDAVRGAANAAGVSVRTSEAECFAGSFGGVVTELARYADMAVVGLTSGDRGTRSTAEAVLFGSGRPVIVVPEAVQPTTPDRVMIAWDGSRSAARAVADSFPLLERARSITIATVTAEKPLPQEDIGHRLSAYLALRDIHAEAIRIPGAGADIGDLLQEHAARIGATLLVMGAFGHSRVRDFVLGGATRGVLAKPRMPILLSH